MLGRKVGDMSLADLRRWIEHEVLSDPASLPRPRPALPDELQGTESNRISPTVIEIPYIQGRSVLHANGGTGAGDILWRGDDGRIYAGLTGGGIAASVELVGAAITRGGAAFAQWGVQDGEPTTASNGFKASVVVQYDPAQTPDSWITANAIDGVANVSKTILGGDGRSDFVTKIAEATVAVAGASSIDISSIPQVFRHLYIVGYFRKTGTSTDTVALRYNGDTGVNYGYESTFSQFTGAPATVNSETASSLRCGTVVGSGTDSQFTAVAGHLPMYSQSSTRKSITGTYSAYLGQMVSEMWGGRYFGSANAITQITFIMQGGGLFDAGSTVSIYGIP